MHTDVKSDSSWSGEPSKVTQSLSALLFDALLRHIMKPTTEKCNRDHHGERLVRDAPNKIEILRKFFETQLPLFVYE